MASVPSNYTVKYFGIIDGSVGVLSKKFKIPTLGI